MTYLNFCLRDIPGPPNHARSTEAVAQNPFDRRGPDDIVHECYSSATLVTGHLMNLWRPLLGLAVIFAPASLAGAAAQEAPGAAVPWVTYEAEQAKTNGTRLGPDYTGRTPAREASGRRCVRLAETGQFIEFTAKADAQGMVVRYCIPDSADGRGIDATLGLYINGSLRQKLAMSSRYCYLYGNYPFSNDPSSGPARHFWDELRLMPGAIHRGDVIRLQKDADDAAGQYLIDFVDLEQVPAPLERPAGSISVTDFGAKADKTSDSHAAFAAAIAAGKARHQVVWIPSGEYVVKGPLQVS